MAVLFVALSGLWTHCFAKHEYTNASRRLLMTLKPLYAQNHATINNPFGAGNGCLLDKVREGRRMGPASKLPFDAELGAKSRAFARDCAAGRTRNLPVGVCFTCSHHYFANADFGISEGMPELHEHELRNRGLHVRPCSQPLVCREHNGVHRGLHLILGE